MSGSEEKIVDFDRLQDRLAGTPIRRALIKLVSVFNSVAAVCLVVVATIAGAATLGVGGFFLGLVVGVVVAVELCGFIAILLDIRDLLAAGKPRGSTDDGR
jgi:hypothetical protein